MSDDPDFSRRRYPRVKTDAIFAVARVDAADGIGYAMDLSEGGIRFQCVGLGFEPGEFVRVTLNLGGKDVTAVGRVVRAHRLDDFAQELAMAFVSASPETLELLQDYIEDSPES